LNTCLISLKRHQIEKWCYYLGPSCTTSLDYRQTPKTRLLFFYNLSCAKRKHLKCFIKQDPFIYTVTSQWTPLGDLFIYTVTSQWTPFSNSQIIKYLKSIIIPSIIFFFKILWQPFIQSYQGNWQILNIKNLTRSWKLLY
jgi:hypothetical protein